MSLWVEDVLGFFAYKLMSLKNIGKIKLVSVNHGGDNQSSKLKFHFVNVFVFSVFYE